eukprot:gnl/Chilomastix_caulleri/773.p2 GENE.gnl/Chilomastix_caulleri/773~~gnl/Chilomastix_caulleri/773.p2  ORF type:complete len:94 (+),score=32.07 gnl/Chilomastix_caulleri/773:112-393(+)
MERLCAKGPSGRGKGKDSTGDSETDEADDTNDTNEDNTITTIKGLHEPSAEMLREMDVPALQSVTKKLKKLLKCYRKELDSRNAAFSTMAGLM